MKITVKSLGNQDVREIELAEDVFGVPYNEHLIHTVVVAHLAGLRAGTHKTKVRSEVAGAGKKRWRQKGTGRARMGSVRSPLWRKGGTVHGPQPRSYAQKVSVGEKKVALRSALSQKLAQDELMVVDSLTLENHKTKALAATVGGLGLARKVLFVDSRDNENLALAARNNPALKTVDALHLNVYDVVDRDHVVISEAALARVTEVLSR
ncbi:MAG: 50S ribosomal protein L4 [Acidobacteriota bacterium]